MASFERSLWARAVSLAAALAASAPAAATPSIVVDVASGQVLEQEQPTSVWYPASLTKLMTMYVALSAVRQGRLTLDTPLVISARAARMSPSKMGFRPGSEVTLQNAMVMLMVKSANDIAVAIAEGVSGSVEAFADEMNQAAQSLGMNESHWVNPNGLPDDRQVTSARDLALLARALLTQFPESASYYNIGAMQLGNRITRTHNGMLGRYPGADGMKTGFTCPAGFNLVASATRGGTRLVAVVLGAPSPNARTAKAAALLDRAFASGSAQGHVASLQGFGLGAPPNMRDAVCRGRSHATEEFLAEIGDVTIPLDAWGAQQISVKDLPHLTPAEFEPVRVFQGRVPGWQGPVARARPPGTPVGTDAALSAYATDKPAAASTNEAAPILQPAPDAKSMRAPHHPRVARRHAPVAKAAPPAKPAPSKHAAKPAPKNVKHKSPAPSARLAAPANAPG